ncbi:MAG: MBOAT family protein [Spirochaetaceae bacterium]|jgi:D-alanyl-lipoteichoic acid acyltransferase DltB (MBOAT superfamily)|nr:MBOAT family protein [Spirochaetaceae bacterium]
MVFSSGLFLFLFLPLVLTGYFNPLVKGRLFKNAFLLLASIGFYAWGEPVFVLVMLFSIGVNWLLGLLMARQEGRSARKILLCLGVGYNVALLGVFKYASFIALNLGLLLRGEGFGLSIALPIGISFFTFQILSYLFDVYYRKTQVQPNPLHLALYIALFPQLIAGPIVRYETIAQEITDRREKTEDVVQGFSRFILGLSKKVLIANYVGYIADQIFSLEGELSLASAWLGAVAYTLQIFFDFAGYSDMAIGLGRIFGFHFLENFNYPYMAVSIRDFWRRWHISLGAWFRDYVYIPLGGNRVSAGRQVVNLLLVWFLTGLWHGAAWTFIIWGLFYLALILLEKFTEIDRKLKGFSRLYTLLFVIIGWVIFRAESLHEALRFLKALFGLGRGGLTDETFTACLSQGKWVLLVAVAACTPLFAVCRRKLASWGRFYQGAAAAGYGALFLLSLLVCIKSAYNPFLYFNF